jgi:uncharacterized protein
VTRRWTLVAGSLLVPPAFLAASACVSLRRTPEARFFVLRATAELADAQPAAVAGLVGVLPVRLPEHLLRPQLVRRAEPNELRIDEFLRWSEPLDAGVDRTLVENLGMLLPQARVVRSPWPANARPRCRVATSVRLFGAQPDGSVRLEGRFTLLEGREERAIVQRPFAFSRRPPPATGVATDAGAVVEAMSGLLGDLAADIAAAVATLPEPAADAP